jgi:hypothetical protein
VQKAGRDVITKSDGMAHRMDMTETFEELHDRIAQRIRPYVEPHSVAAGCMAVLSGQVIRVDADVPPGAGVIALRRGILFVPDGEYRVGEE